MRRISSATEYALFVATFVPPLIVVVLVLIIVSESVVSPPVAHAQSGNLVLNGDFNAGTSNWNWSPLTGVEACCAGGGPSGYQEAYAHPDGSNTFLGPWQRITNPLAGNYTLTGWIRTSGVGQQVYVTANDGTGHTYCSSAPTATTTWQSYSCTFSYPVAGNASAINVGMIVANGSATAGGWVTWDDMSLVSSQPANLVVNGTYGANTSNWNWSPLTGIETCCAGGGPSGYPEAYAHPDGSNTFIGPWQGVGNPPAGNYTLTGWIRTSGGAQQVYVTANDGTGHTYCNSAPTATTTWQSYSCTFSYPLAAHSSAINVGVMVANGSATAGGWVAWDDVSLSTGGSGGNGTIIPVPFISQYQGLSSSNCDCGPAAVAMTIRSYGLDTTSSDAQLVTNVRQATGTSSIPCVPGQSGDTTFVNLETAISAYALRPSEIGSAQTPPPTAMQAMQSATNAGQPVIALVHGDDLGRGAQYGDHWVVVRGFSNDGQTVYINDPDTQPARAGYPNWIVGGPITLSYQTFSAAAQHAQAGPYGIIVAR